MDKFLMLLNSDLKVTELLLSSDGPETIFDNVSGGDGWAFLLITAFGLAMALVYIPIRLFLTITARSRRLKLLQRIRKLREVIAEPIDNDN